MDSFIRVFASYHHKDKLIYETIRNFSKDKNKNFIVFPLDLNNEFRRDIRSLYNTDKLYKYLGKPNFSIVILSENHLANSWITEELRGLFAVEQYLNRQFIIPVLTGNITESDVPSYIRQQTIKCIDLRGEKYKNPANLNKIALQIEKLLEPTKKIFIGHGNSLTWILLKDFLNDDLKLNYDEFNRESNAGKSNKERLLEILNGTEFSFHILSNNDQPSEGGISSRENVIYEIGLFQGKLGFERAIILREEGCNKFENVEGINDIIFPSGNLRASFEEIREILKRGRLIM